MDPESSLPPKEIKIQESEATKLPYSWHNQFDQNVWRQNNPERTSFHNADHVGYVKRSMMALYREAIKKMATIH